MKKILFLFSFLSLLVSTASAGSIATAESPAELTVWTVSPTLTRSTSAPLNGSRSYLSSGFCASQTYSIKSPAQAWVGYWRKDNITAKGKLAVNLPSGYTCTVEVILTDESDVSKPTLTLWTSAPLSNTFNGTFGFIAGPLSPFYGSGEDIGMAGPLISVTFKYTTNYPTCGGSYWVKTDDIEVGEYNVILSSTSNEYPSLTFGVANAYQTKSNASSFSAYGDIVLNKPAQNIPSTGYWPAGLQINTISKSTGRVVSSTYDSLDISLSTSATVQTLKSDVLIEDDNYYYVIIFTTYCDASGSPVWTVYTADITMPTNTPTLVQRSSASINHFDPCTSVSPQLYMLTSGGTKTFYTDKAMTSTFSGGSQWWVIRPYTSSGDYQSKINYSGVEIANDTCY